VYWEDLNLTGSDRITVQEDFPEAEEIFAQSVY